MVAIHLGLSEPVPTSVSTNTRMEICHISRTPVSTLAHTKKFGFLDSITGVKALNYIYEHTAGYLNPGPTGEIYGHEITPSISPWLFSDTSWPKKTGVYNFTIAGEDGTLLRLGTGRSCSGDALVDAIGTHTNGEFDVQYTDPDGAVVTDIGLDIYQGHRVYEKQTTTTWTGSYTTVSTVTGTDGITSPVVLVPVSTSESSSSAWISESSSSAWISESSSSAWISESSSSAWISESSSSAWISESSSSTLMGSYTTLTTVTGTDGINNIVSPVLSFSSSTVPIIVSDVDTVVSSVGLMTSLTLPSGGWNSTYVIPPWLGSTSSIKESTSYGISSMTTETRVVTMTSIDDTGVTKHVTSTLTVTYCPYSMDNESGSSTESLTSFTTTTHDSDSTTIKTLTASSTYDSKPTNDNSNSANSANGFNSSNGVSNSENEHRSTINTHVPTGAVPDADVPSVPTGSVSGADIPSAPTKSVSNDDVPSVPTGSVPDADVPSAPTKSVSNDDVPSVPTGSVPDANVPSAPTGSVPDADVPSVATKSVSGAGVPSVPTGSVPDADVSSVPTGSVPDADVPSAPTGSVSDADVPSVATKSVSGAGVPSVPTGSVPDADVPSVPTGSVSGADVPSVPTKSGSGADIPSAPTKSVSNDDVPSVPTGSVPDADVPSVATKSVSGAGVPSVATGSVPDAGVPSVATKSSVRCWCTFCSYWITGVCYTYYIGGFGSYWIVGLRVY
ncbi:hypothetical protein JCM33374_g6180 [Metschnikowia sp. JCM 33374]|nr:hypothetical protein JCM33374_g6180 [Metschnikowia sp. JCM 33374]